MGFFDKAFRSVSRAVKSVAKNPVKAVSTVALGGLNQHWLADMAARKIVGEKNYRQFTPKQIAPALDLMHNVGRLTPSDVAKMAKGDVSQLNKLTGKAVNVLASGAEGGAIYADVSPALAANSKEILDQVDQLRKVNTPAAKKIVDEFDKRVALARTERAKQLNRIVRGYFSNDANEKKATQAKVAELRARAAKGDKVAAHEATLLRRRKAALDRVREYTVDRSGVARRAS